MRARWPLAVLLLLPLLVACEAREPANPIAGAQPTASAPAGTPAVLSNPRNPELNEQGPEVWKARFQTSQGNFTVEVHRDWSPHGADRFYNLVANGYFEQVRFFRAIPGFMVQFGIHGDPAIAKRWLESNLPDDPVKQSNTRGRITYAKSGAPNSRSVQVFINYGDNSRLDKDGFAPFGEIIEGMEVVDALYGGYGEMPGMVQSQLAMQGNAWLDASYPELDRILSASVVE